MNWKIRHKIGLKVAIIEELHKEIKPEPLAGVASLLKGLIDG